MVPSSEPHSVYSHRVTRGYRYYRHSCRDTFPSLSRAREKARQAACLSNQKQIGLAVLQYIQDYDEFYPMRYGGACPPDCEFNKPRSWKNMLMPYIKNYDVFKCPSNPAAQQFDQIGTNATDKTNAFAGGYAMWLPDTFLCSRFGNGCSYPQNQAGIPAVADSLLILETSYRFPDTGPYLGYAEPAPNDPNIVPGPSSWNSGHSKNRCNIIYMDGHVKFKYLKQTFEERGNPVLNEWRFSEAIAIQQNITWDPHPARKSEELSERLEEKPKLEARSRRTEQNYLIWAGTGSKTLGLPPGSPPT